MSVPTDKLPADVKRLLARRSQKSAVIGRRFEKLADDVYTISLPVLMRDIDETTRSAAFCISTEDIDRSGDRVHTNGIRTENHRANPVVLFDHGRGPIGKQPIGMTEDPARAYTVVIVPEAGVAVARVYFSDKTQFARETWELVKDRMLRGASIAFRAINGQVMPGYSPDDEDAPLDLTEIELCELSITPVPDNDRALLISKAAGGDRPSVEMIAKLDRFSKGEMAVANTATANVTAKSNSDDYLPMDEDGKVKDGMDETSAANGGAAVPPNAADANVTVKDVDLATPGQDKPSARDITDDVTKKDMADGDGDVIDDVSDQTEKGLDEPPLSPPGNAALTELHDHLAGAGDIIERHSKLQENPEVKATLDDAADRVNETMKSLALCHQKEYPEADRLEGSDVDEKSDDDIAAEEGENEDEEIEGPDGQKSIKINRLRFKSMARVRLENRSTKVRAKAAKKAAERAKKLKEKSAKTLKSVADAFTKAANYLEQAAALKDLPAAHKKVAAFHAKSIRAAARLRLPAADNTAAPAELKALKDENARLAKERDDYKEKAVKATETAERFAKANKELRNKAGL